MKEICFNLWHYPDSQPNINAITANADALEGDDERNGHSLRDRAAND